VLLSHMTSRPTKVALRYQRQLDLYRVISRVQVTLMQRMVLRTAIPAVHLWMYVALLYVQPAADTRMA
jgi:hypothetical protein